MPRWYYAHGRWFFYTKVCAAPDSNLSGGAPFCSHHTSASDQLASLFTFDCPPPQVLLCFSRIFYVKFHCEKGGEGLKRQARYSFLFCLIWCKLVRWCSCFRRGAIHSRHLTQKTKFLAFCYSQSRILCSVFFLDKILNDTVDLWETYFKRRKHNKMNREKTSSGKYFLANIS